MTFEEFRKKYYLFKDPIANFFYYQNKGTAEEWEAIEKVHASIAAAAAESPEKKEEEVDQRQKDVRPLLLNEFPSVKELSSYLVFRVINPYHLQYLRNGNDDSIFGDEVDVYCYQPTKQFHDNITYFTAKSKEALKYQIFVTFFDEYRREMYFDNRDQINEHFIATYEISFFDNENNNSEWGSLDNKFTYDDFEKVISPNLKLELFEEYSLENMPKEYCIFYNWDFFAEQNVFPLHHNVLYKNTEALFNIYSFSSNEKIELIKKAMVNVAWGSSRGPDTTPIGVAIDDKIQEQIENKIFDTSLIAIHERIASFDYRAKTYTHRLYFPLSQSDAMMNEKYSGKDDEFLKDFDQMILVFKENLLPFVIVDNLFLLQH